ncbi:hypothetical protein L2E82_36484 [Cichorium intybus]|uniref:Uncharacterized protein n=1 Tax=Cichorium intybus TaxID=13427 RepID=A0ACB9BRS4_CICIN|nr:hypothetical protein L2E82_36484 [Cichorium intybus]
MMLSEVETLEKWIVETKLSTMRPNTMNNYGVVLMTSEDFIHHISKSGASPLCGFRVCYPPILHRFSTAYDSNCCY